MTRANAERVAAKTGRTPEEVLAKIVAAQPSGRLVTPDEVAHATLSFLADEAGAMNGASLVVDGGGHMP